MENVKITTEYITLGQMLKFTGIISNGSEAKSFLSTSKIEVNGEIECRRGRKLYNDYEVKVGNKLYKIVKE